VAVPGRGGLAELAAVPADLCVPLPDGMAAVDAAAFSIAYGTSHLALVRRARLEAGETLLVLGAAGGVGLTAVELGALMGARVIAAARGAEKLEVARAAGAQHLVDADGDLTEAVKALGGADVVYDPVGGPLYRAALSACRPEARYLVIGFAGGVPEVRPGHLLVKNVSLIGHYWGGYLSFRPEVVRESLTTLLGWYAEGRLRPHVSHVLPLDRAGEGLELIRTRASTGKVVVTP
jgi:NADPH2:quinone reductase